MQAQTVKVQTRIQKIDKDKHLKPQAVVLFDQRKVILFAVLYGYPTTDPLTKNQQQPCCQLGPSEPTF